jgi:ABC-type Zn uptake system ZnuABC Zn-binding protein ZnuA
MNMKRITRSPAWRRALALALLGILFAGIPARVAAKVRVVASINDLASIANSVGGDEVEVVTIAKATADPHRVEVLPSYMVRVTKAALYLKVGLSLDRWADQIIFGARNDHLLVVDCSSGIAVLDKPAGKVDASMGDVHPEGNPHYWLDPRNGGIVAREVAVALGRIDPAHAAEYAARAERFAAACDSTAVAGRARVAALPVRAFVSYHSSWVYFADTFGLEIAATVEPKPGIPPTARHLEDVRRVITAKQVGALFQEPYFSDDASTYLARETGVRVARVSPSSSGPEAGSYLAHFTQLIDFLTGSGKAGAP